MGEGGGGGGGGGLTSYSSQPHQINLPGDRTSGQ